LAFAIYPSESEEKQGIQLDSQNTEWLHHVNIIELLSEIWIVPILYSS